MILRMQPDDKPPTPTDDRSPDPRTLSAEEFWAEKRKPFRQRNLTPAQRKELLDSIRWYRRQHFEGNGNDVPYVCRRPWIDD